LKESLLLIKAHFLDFLRVKAVTKSINLTITIIEPKQEDVQRIPYSPKEKLLKLQEDYPDMKSFIEVFEFRFKM